MRIDGKKRHFWWLQISNDCNFLPAFFPRFFHCPIGQYHDTLPTINFQSVSTNYPSSSNKPSKRKNISFWDAIWTRYSAFIINMFLIFKSFIWDMKPAISCLESAGHPTGGRRHTLLAEGPSCTLSSSYSQLISLDVGVWTEWLNSLANGPPPALHLSSTPAPHFQIPQILQILKSEHCLAEGSEGGFANWVYVHTQGSGATHTPPREGRLKRRQEKLSWACFSLKRIQIILSFKKGGLGLPNCLTRCYDTFRRPTKGLEWREEISWWKLWNQWQKVAKTPQSQKHSWPTFWRKGYEVCSLSQPILTSLPNLLDYMGRKLCYSLQQVNYHCITGSWTP